jgi:membrane-associated phospholipid phosphatase
MDVLIQWGLPIVQWIQTFRTPFLDAFFRAASFLGEGNFYILFFPIVYWCLHRKIGSRLAVLFLFSAYANAFFKNLFATLRPYQVDPTLYSPLRSTGYGIPSGHTQEAIAVWSYPATQLRTRLWWALAFVLPILIGLSRIYLGDHFPQDVIAGALIGTIFLALYVALEPRVSHWFATHTNLWTRLAIAIAVPLALAALYLTDGAVQLGALWGAMIGFVLEEEWIRFDHHAPPARQIVKLALGLAVALGLRLGLKAILPDGDIWNFMRYGVIGFWVAFGAPWVFVHTRLAEQSSRQPPLISHSPIVELESKIEA